MNRWILSCALILFVSIASVCGMGGGQYADFRSPSPEVNQNLQADFQPPSPNSITYIG